MKESELTAEFRDPERAKARLTKASGLGTAIFEVLKAVGNDDFLYRMIVV